MTVPVLTPAEIAACRAEEAEARRRRPAPPPRPAPAPIPPDAPHAAFRALLKGYRERRRWSQERAAAECGIDHSLISRWESGHRAPTRDGIGKLAVGLELTPWQHDDLLMAAGYLPASVAPDDLRGAVALLRETTAEERDAAKALSAAARRGG